MSERLDALAEQIAAYSLRIDLATQAMLTYLREFDSLDGWEGSGFVSTATWLAWRTGISPSAAREHVRVARALGGCSSSTRLLRLGSSAIRRFGPLLGPRRRRRSRPFWTLPCTPRPRRWSGWPRPIGVLASILRSRTRICVGSLAVVKRAVEWCGSTFNCRPTKPTWSGRRCSPRWTLVGARRVRALPRRRGERSRSTLK